MDLFIYEDVDFYRSKLLDYYMNTDELSNNVLLYSKNILEIKKPGSI